MVLIARALVCNLRSLILDEATSSLDKYTQRKVLATLNKIKCTRIVISHRLTTIKQCNRIIVLDKGKLIEDGSYEELINKNGYFKELVKGRQIANS